MKRKLGIILAILFEFLIFFIEKKYYGNYFYIDRFFIFSCINIFAFSHLIFDVKKMYDFIYRKRYLIGIVLLLLITILEYHGSSLSLWNQIVQPNHDVDNGGIILGVARGIRGDEYIVSTPTLLSQVFNNFSSINHLLMGKSSLVTLFPTLPSFNISIIANLFNLVYLFLPIGNAFACSWFLKVFVAFFATFELCMLITKKNKLYSLMGAFLIVLSPVSVWWSNMAIIAWGPLALLLINKFIKEKVIAKKILYTLLISVVGVNYIMMMYPAWEVPFGYVYLCFIIWILVENKKELNWKQLLYLFLAIALMGTVIFIIFKQSYEIYLMTVSTVYPGARFSTGGKDYVRLYDYFINIFFPYKSFFNPCEYSNFISFYPIPIFYSIYIICSQIKNNIKKKLKNIDLLLILLVISALLLSFWNYIELPKWFAKISLLSFSTTGRAQLVVGYICIFMLVRIMALYEENNKTITKKKIISCIIAIVTTVIGIYIMKSNFGNFVTKKEAIIIILLFVPLITLICINNKKTNKFIAIFLIILSLYAGGTVNPISKGLAPIYEKPFAKKVQSIVKNDKNAKWISTFSNYGIPNYLVANGASTINSTNYYPNLKLWYLLDTDHSDEFIYNRYAHITINLTNDVTHFELIYEDAFCIYLNVNDLNKLNVTYITSQQDISGFSNENITLGELYNEDGMYIYKIIYKNIF